MKVAITKIVQKLDLDDDLKNKVLGSGYVTTFWRLIEQSPAQTVFGISVNDQKQVKIDDKDFANKLKVVVWDVLQNRKYNDKLFSRLNVKDIEGYLKNISEQDYKRVQDEIKDTEKKKVTNLFGERSILPNKERGLRRTPILKLNSTLFGGALYLKSGQTNNLYSAIDRIYSQNQNDDVALPIIGMSLRLLLEVAGREYFLNCDDDEKKSFAKEDKVYEKFLKEAKATMDKKNENYSSLTLDWISSKETITGLLHKYAHGNILSNRNDILQSSMVVADILKIYFLRDKK